MEVALILYMCSAIQKTCLEPYVWPDRFYDQYGCMVAGYEESGKKIAEIGRKEVNKHDIYIKFECHPYKITFPKMQLELILNVCPSQERDEQTKGVRRDLSFIIKK